MKIESPSFANKQKIPKKHSCEGEDISPELVLSDIPKDVKSFALIVEDPDAPGGVFDHWIAWNIPADTKKLPEGAKVPKQGMNGFGDKRYRGPCPPPGKAHRYFFKLYALDSAIDIPENSRKAALEEAMEGHIMGEAQLIGLYQR